MGDEIEKVISVKDEDVLLKQQTLILLQQEIDYLINNDFNKLVQVLYQIDISEKKLNALLQQNPQADASKIIAVLVIERQLQKIKTRQQFTRKSDNSSEERW